MTKFKALTIAGSDASGGAGLEADLKTFQELGVYGMVAVTVVVAENPFNNWSHDIYPLPAEALDAQLDTILTGIGVDALKTGMLATADIIERVAHKLKQTKVKNIVIDPVLACKGTSEVLNPDSADALAKILAPLATVFTPNIFEATVLSGLSAITTEEDMKKAAQAIYKLGPQNVLIKGGAKIETAEAVDLLYNGQDFVFFRAPKIATTFTHGAGCTYGAAVTAGLARGLDVHVAVRQAKDFTHTAIKNGFKLNQYVGAVWQGAYKGTH